MTASSPGAPRDRSAATPANSFRVFRIWLAVAVTVWSFVYFTSDTDSTVVLDDAAGVMFFGMIYAAGFAALAVTVGPWIARGLLRLGMNALQTGTATFFTVTGGATCLFSVSIRLLE